MNIAYYSFILGPVILLFLYALCLVLVVGVKVFVYLLKNKLNENTEQNIPPKNRPKRQTKKYKSIEIDYDSVDKIYFKKSS